MFRNSYVLWCLRYVMLRFVVVPSYMFDWVDYIPQAGTKNLASELLQAQLRKTKHNR